MTARNSTDETPKYLRNTISGAIYPYHEGIAHLDHIVPYTPKKVINSKTILGANGQPAEAQDPRLPVVLDSNGVPVRPARQGRSRLPPVVEKIPTVVSPLGNFGGDDPFAQGDGGDGGVQ